jgi:Domain of unknown function (DUF4129)
MKVSPSFRFGLGLGVLAMAIALIGSPRAYADEPGATVRPPTGRWQDASLDDHRKHLEALETLTNACAKARDVKTCDPTLVGLDDRVLLGTEPGAQRRIVRYGWLRVLLSRAEEPDKAHEAPKSDLPIPALRNSIRPDARTVSQLLEDAEARLATDLARLEATTKGTGPTHPVERHTLQQVLAGREFRDLHKAGATDSAFELVGNWLNRFFESVGRLRARSAWVGRALVAGFLLLVGVGLAWGLMQLERRWRIRLVPEAESPAPEAASARDWQLWLADAREAAAEGLWREAIHSVYWSAISRLESKRLWPADRARTPREYLTLLAPDDPRRTRLSLLTRSFEHTWYGGRPAHEDEFRRAEELAAGLASGRGAEAPQGGPR